MENQINVNIEPSLVIKSEHMSLMDDKSENGGAGLSCDSENQTIIPEAPSPPSIDRVKIEIGSPALKEEFKEETRADLGLDFLDDLTFEDLLKVEDQTESLQVKLEPLTIEPEVSLPPEVMESHSHIRSPPMKKARETEQKAKKRNHRGQKLQHFKEPMEEQTKTMVMKLKPSTNEPESGQIEEGVESLSLMGKEQKPKRKRHRIRRRKGNHSNSVDTSMVKSEPMELIHLPTGNSKKHEGKAATVLPAAITTILSIAEKRKLAVERVTAVLELQKRKSSKVPATEFLVVDTIRKLPSSSALLSRGSFENPSPLCNNRNVKYKFNSTTTAKINIAKWGLESFPSVTTELLRLTGIDVNRLMELLKNSKMRLQKQTNKTFHNTEDDGISTGLFRSLSTQTDKRLVNSTRNVGIQTMPISQNSGIFWLDSRFSESKLCQQQANVMLALKELCATSPSSTFWADAIYNSLHNALQIKRQEVKEIALKRNF